MGLVGCFGADSQVELGSNMSIAYGCRDSCPRGPFHHFCMVCTYHTRNICRIYKVRVHVQLLYGSTTPGYVLPYCMPYYVLYVPVLA